MVTSSAVVGSSAIEQIGPVQQRDGDRDALAHAARELVRIGRQALFGARDADHAESVARACAGLGVRDPLVRLHRLDHLRVDAQDRIQRHHRVLEDHRDAAAAQGAHLALGQLVRSAPCSRIEPPAIRPGGSTRPMMEKPVTVLPEPDSPTRPSTWPRVDGERDAVDRLDHARTRKEMRAQVAHFEGRGAHRCSRGFSTSRN